MLLATTISTTSRNLNIFTQVEVRPDYLLFKQKTGR